MEIAEHIRKGLQTSCLTFHREHSGDSEQHLTGGNLQLRAFESKPLWLDLFYDKTGSSLTSQKSFDNKTQATSTISVKSKEYFLSSICRVQDNSKHFEITNLLIIIII